MSRVWCFSTSPGLVDPGTGKNALSVLVDEVAGNGTGHESRYLPDDQGKIRTGPDPDGLYRWEIVLEAGAGESKADLDRMMSELDEKIRALEEPKVSEACPSR